MGKMKNDKDNKNTILILLSFALVGVVAFFILTPNPNKIRAKVEDYNEVVDSSFDIKKPSKKTKKQKKETVPVIESVYKKQLEKLKQLNHEEFEYFSRCRNFLRKNAKYIKTTRKIEVKDMHKFVNAFVRKCSLKLRSGVKLNAFLKEHPEHFQDIGVNWEYRIGNNITALYEVVDLLLEDKNFKNYKNTLYYFIKNQVLEPSMNIYYLKHLNVFVKRFSKKCKLGIQRELNQLDIQISDAENDIYIDSVIEQNTYNVMGASRSIAATKTLLSDYEEANMYRQELLEIMNGNKSRINDCLRRR